MGVNITKEEFVKKSSEHLRLLTSLCSSNERELVIMLQLWDLLKIEQKLNPIIEEFGWECVREKHPTGMIYGRIKKDDKEIGYYGVQPWPEVIIYNFVKYRGKVADALIRDYAIKPMQGVHRILDWHSLIKNGYIQELARKQWVIHMVPETPTKEELEKLLIQVKEKSNSRLIEDDNSKLSVAESFFKRT